MSIGAFLCGRNDNYGFNLVERFAYAVNSMVTELDEVFYVDWNTDPGKPSLVEEAQHLLLRNGNFKWVVVDSDLAKEWTPNDPEAQAVVEVMARNIGLRRLTTDYRVSTNVDIVCPTSKYFEQMCIPRTVVTAGKRNMPFEIMHTLGPCDQPSVYRTELDKLLPAYGQQPSIQIMAGDIYSLVSGCGDWQVAHKDVWFDFRGFEERLYKRQHADTNVNRKAAFWGYDIKVDWSIPVWHINHGGGAGGRGGVNDPYLSTFMCETTNSETWGFSDKELQINTL